MAFQEQISKLVVRLTELTNQDRLAWEETADENAYLASAGDFVVSIGRSGISTYASCHLRVLDRTGKIIEEAFATSAPASHEDWDRLRILYELARRRALRSEKAVTDLLSSLEQIR